MQGLARAILIIGQKFDAYQEHNAQMRGSTRQERISLRILVPQHTVGVLIGRKGNFCLPTFSRALVSPS